MRFTVAFVVAAAALFTADAAKINTRRRLGNNNNKNNAATQERNLSSGKGKGGKGKGYDSTVLPDDSALSRAEAEGLNRGQICAAGQARASVLEMILPLNMADSTGKGKAGKGGKSGKVSKSVNQYGCIYL